MKRILSKTVAIALVLCSFLATSSSAQNADNKWALSGFASVYQWQGNSGSELYDWREGRTGGGFSISRYLSPSFDFGVSFSGARVDYNNSVAAGIRPGDANNFHFTGEMRNIMPMLKLKLNSGKILKEEARIAPYLVGGYGIAFSDIKGRGRHGVFPPRGTDGDLTHATPFGGAGINFRLTDRVGLNVQTGIMFLKTNQYEGYRAANLDDNVVNKIAQHNFGLTFALGKAKDTDMDGVPDRKDKCPDTPSGVKVDENGCPVDTDKDGVADYQDNCPDVAGVAALNGCPDRDNDGVADAQDECPDQAGTAALRGCPDADKDGVADKNDKCPDTPAGTQVGADGCPLVRDADGDGVNDDVDKCADTPAGTAVGADGCPIRKPIPRGVGRGNLGDTTYIQFEFDKAVLRKVSFTKLDQIARFLKANPTFDVNVSGHADARGTDEYNQALSERRAAAVARYLTSKGGISKNRITTVGYGESRPRGDNETAAGMALNRRAQVELVVE